MLWVSIKNFMAGFSKECCVVKKVLTRFVGIREMLTR